MSVNLPRATDSFPPDDAALHLNPKSQLGDLSLRGLPLTVARL
jgi:hypothetical protein